MRPISRVTYADDERYIAKRLNRETYTIMMNSKMLAVILIKAEHNKHSLTGVKNMVGKEKWTGHEMF